MKAIRNFGILKAIAFITTVFFLISCNPQDEPVPPVIKKNLSVVKIGQAQDVKISSAKLTAVVIPNEDNTSVAFEYQTTNSTWSTKVLPTKFSGKDSIKVTFDLSDLQANTVYNFRLRAVNTAGDTVSTSSSFKTYAVADYDGNLYHTVTIGNQTWLQENLKTTHFANGDVIPNVKDMTAWDALTTGAYCYYNNDAKNGEVYGALYNWYIANDPRGLIVGYRTPEGQDWNTLSKNYSSRSACGIAMMETGKTHWTNPSMTATNSTGFTALPNGGLSADKASKIGLFNYLGSDATFWSSDTYGNSALTTIISQTDCRLTFEGLYLKAEGLGIRLIKK